MNDEKQRRLPKLLERREMREVGHYVNLDKKVHAGDVSDLWTSHMSKSITQGCTLPAIGNGQLTNQHTGNIMHPGSSKMVSTRFPPLPVKEAAHQQVKRSTASRLGLDKLPVLPADSSTKEGSLPRIVLDCNNEGSSPTKGDRLTPVHLPPINCCTNMVASHQIVNNCSIKEGSTPKRDTGIPVRLLPTENMSQSSSSRLWTTGFNHETGLNNFCKLPDIKEAQVKRSRPKCGDVHKLPCVLPSILPESHRMDKTKRKRRKM